MKIPFTLDVWLKDKSQKVETREGRPVKIISFEMTDTNGCPIAAQFRLCAGTPVVYLFDKDGHYKGEGDSNYDLFIVTPEPELSEFEDGLRQICEDAVKEAAVFPYRTSEDFAKRHSAELLALAREQFIKDGYVIEKKAFHDAVENIDNKHQAEMSVQYSLHCKIQNGTRHAVMNWSEFQKSARMFIGIGKAEALRIHATELTENLAKSGMDKDSIPYHLIEFMCNLYTCQNWKEIEETAEAYVTRIKAAAMKDLPRWRKWENGACGNGRGIPLAIVKRGLNGYELVDALGILGEQYIMLSDLKKLPGFNE